MLHTPLWKRLLILAIIVWGILAALPNAFYTRVEQHNDAIKAITAAEGVATEQQAAARALWPEVLPSGLMALGLDLRGGAHLLANVQVADVYAQRIDALWPEVRDKLRDVRDQVGSVRRQPSVPGVLRVAISNPDGMTVALETVRALAVPVMTLTGAGSSDLEIVADGQEIVVQLSEAERVATDARTVQQSLEIIRRRVDEVGTREPTIQRQGDDRILIQVPGIGSAQELKDLIGTTAKLTFHQVLGRTADAGADPGARNRLVGDAYDKNTFYIIADASVVSGEELTDAQPSFDQNGRPAVSFRFNPSGARAFGDYTAAHIGEPFAIVLDERTIGPELGQDSIDAGKLAGIVGMVAVAAYMVLSYGLFGVFANIALAVNVILLIALLSTIGATLTLPGIAGIVLTMGVAVDSNVLIYERIREELRDGKSAVRAIELGFERAFSAILDSNITGIITAVIMFMIGSGAVRGFAVTTGIGIFTSMFTAVYVTRLIVTTYINWRQPKELVV